MAVYIDNAFIPYRRMLMCHMIADSTDELMAMADQIGVARKWIQNPGKQDEHFDVCKEAREKAIRYGAVEITTRELATKIRDRRATGGA